jgi:hypothetical protein
MLLLRIILVVLALASAGLGVALSLSLTPSRAIVRSIPQIPIWEATHMVLPSASDSEPQPPRPTDATFRHASLNRDIV